MAEQKKTKIRRLAVLLLALVMLFGAMSISLVVSASEDATPVSVFDDGYELNANWIWADAEVEKEQWVSMRKTFTLDEVPEVVSKYGGVCYPAHIDRDANGIIAILGTIPPTPDFSAYEIRDKENADKYVSSYSLEGKVIVIDSDSHYLTDFKDAESYLELNCDKSNEGEVIRALFAYLRHE